MKILSRILTICLCCVCAARADAAGPVATTAGSNLTAYNPSNAYNNQWATLTNGRNDGTTSAKADFGNCNALIMRCAQPKCTSGCSDITVAAAIVKGCVQSNKSCEQYGDDLVNYMSAQLVANSNAKVNEQQAAAAQQQALAQQQQMAQMQSEMQQQMYQMQQQMAQQQAESQYQLQEALAAQAAQSQQALESMRAAATESAQETEAGISSYQQEAIDRGISTDILERQKVTGQILTEIENAETSLSAVKVAMNSTFEYAGCDARGNNCTGPKRVKKFRELASEFLDPYDNTIVKLYDALTVAQGVGVDMSQIYMMLDDSCNAWGQYMCPQMPGGRIVYNYSDNANKSAPMVCPQKTQEEIGSCEGGCIVSCETAPDSKKQSCKTECSDNCKKNSNCVPCTMLKTLTSQDDVYEGWVQAEKDTSNGNTTVVACASGALDSSKLFARHTRTKSGAGMVDIDSLDNWIHQTESNTKYVEGRSNEEDYWGSCDGTAGKNELEAAASSKIVQTNKLCVSEKGNKNKTAKSDEGCPYISPTYALCDIHVYNVGKERNLNSAAATTERDEMKEIIALKSTVLAQQLYKQYEYLAATLRRFKIQLEKSVLTANLEAAGGKSDNGVSSGGLAGGRSDSDKEIVLAGAENCWNSSSPENAYSCIQTNLNLIKSNASTNKQKAAKQLGKTVEVAKQWGVCVKDTAGNCTDTGDCKGYDSNGGSTNTNAITKCANALSIAVARKISEDKKESNRYSGLKNSAY